MPADHRGSAVTRSADPAALAVAAVVLATVSLTGAGLLNGSNYVLPFTQGAPSTARVVGSGLVGALLAGVPVLLGRTAQRRTHPGDPAWVPRIAQAGVVLGAIAVVLRLVVTATAAAQVADTGFFAPL